MIDFSPEVISEMDIGGSSGDDDDEDDGAAAEQGEFMVGSGGVAA